MRRMRLGVMLVTIDTYYQPELWRGMKSYANEHGIDLLFFCGSPYEAPSYDVSHYNSIYNLIQTDKLDGLITYSGTLGNYIGKEELHKRLQVYHPLPMVSLSFDFSDTQNILINNRAMGAIIDHLIEVHHYNKIAIITGPMTNQDAVERLEAYKDSLLRHGLAYDVNFVVEGRFNQESGARAVRELLDERKVMPQAIAFSNDDMAIGGFLELKERGIVVGKDIFITGYDGLPEVAGFTPPFTTALLPIHAMGYEAVRLLHDRILKKTYDQTLVLDCDLLIRQSCGCLELMSFDMDQSILETLKGDDKNLVGLADFDQWMLSHAKLFFQILEKGYQMHSDRPMNTLVALDLLVAFRQDVIKVASKGIFMERLNQVLLEYQTNNYEVTPWQDALYALFRYISHSPLEVQVRQIVDDIFFLSNALIGEVLERDARHGQYDLGATHQMSIQMIQHFHSVMDVSQMTELLVHHCKRNQVNLLSVCLFDEAIMAQNNGQFDYPETMTAIMTYLGDEIYYNERYDTTEMVPKILMQDPPVLSEDHLVFFPIHFKDRHYGYLITKTESAARVIFRTLREYIGNTLDRMHVYDQLDAYTEELSRISITDVLTGLYNHRGFYEAGEAMLAYHLIGENTLVVIYGDMDDLKSINDLYGHHEGDYAIRKMGMIIMEALPFGAFAGRVGGDEFTIVMLTDSDQPVMDFIYAIEAALTLENRTNGKPYTLGISFGEHKSVVQSTSDFRSLVTQADQALYRVKKMKQEERRRVQTQDYDD